MADIWFADGGASRVVLIGASAFGSDDLPPIPSVRNNLADLQAAFRDPLRGLFGSDPDEHCVVLDLDEAGRTDTAHVGATLSRAGKEAVDLLLVYYAGHGMLDDDGALYLAAAHTDPQLLDFTALPLDVIKRGLSRSRARARVLILDCCFSGRAVNAMASPAALVAGQLDLEGTYILTSTTATTPSHAPRGHRNTAFTAALLRALSAPTPLTMDEIHRHAESELGALGRPLPQRLATGGVSRLALTRGPTSAPAGKAYASRPRRPLPRTLGRTLAAAAIAGAALIGLAVLQQTRQSPLGSVDQSTLPDVPPSSEPGSPRSDRPSGTPTPSTSPPDPRELVVPLFGTNETSDGAVTIGVTAALGMTSQDGSKYAAGGATGPGGGGVAVSADDSTGSSTTGFVDFFVEAPGETCTALGLAIGQSTVVPGGDENWIEIVVVGIADLSRRGAENLPVTFHVSQQAGPEPVADKMCT